MKGKRKPAPAPPLTVQRLLEYFETAARQLEISFEQHPQALDEKRLERIQVVMTACHNIMARNADLGDTRAIVALAAQTRIGCLFLEALSYQPSIAPALKKAVESSPDWPVLKIRKTMKDTNESHWRFIASELMEQIKNYQMILSHIPESPLLKEIRLREHNLPAAEKWKQVLDLPTTPCREWWVVAKVMLKDRWKNNPAEATELFKKVKRSAYSAVESPEAFATRQVRQIFMVMIRTMKNSGL